MNSDWNLCQYNVQIAELVFAPTMRDVHAVTLQRQLLSALPGFSFRQIRIIGSRAVLVNLMNLVNLRMHLWIRWCAARFTKAADLGLIRADMLEPQTLDNDDACGEYRVWEESGIDHRIRAVERDQRTAPSGRVNRCTVFELTKDRATKSLMP